MNFRLSLFNHPAGSGRRSYADIVLQTRACLGELGHAVHEVAPFEVPPAVNLVCEGFNGVTLQTLWAERAAGRRVVMLVTEMPVRASRDALLWNYRVDEYWAERAHYFLQALPYVDALWCLVPGAAATLARYGRQAHDITFGFAAPLLAPVRAEPWADACLFGSRTPRRDAVVGALRRRGLSIVTLWDMPPLVERTATIAQAKVVIDVKAFDWWPVVSTSRISAALYAGRPAVCEARSTPGVWGQVVPFVDDLAAAIEATARRWREAYLEQLLAFKALPWRATLAAAVAAMPATASPVGAAPPQPFTHAPGAEPRLIESRNGHNLVGFGSHVYVVPQHFGTLDLAREEHRVRPGIRRFDTVDQARSAA